MNEKQLNNAVKKIAQAQAVELRNAQQKFVSYHMNNARQIGSKGITNLMGKQRNLSSNDFEGLIANLSLANDTGSEIIFDYSTKSYTYFELEQMLSAYGYRIYEHLTMDDIEQMLSKDNVGMSLYSDISFCLAVKK